MKCGLEISLADDNQWRKQKYPSTTRETYNAKYQYSYV